MTECNEQKWLFQELGYRKVEVDFGGGYLSSDGGGLILRELERHSGLLRDFAGCFIDYCDQRYVEHSVQELVSQRIHGSVRLRRSQRSCHLRRDPVRLPLLELVIRLYFRNRQFIVSAPCDC